MSVPLRFDAVVEDGHAAVVLFGADEAADGLDEFDAGFGDGDFDEGVAAALLYPAVLGFFDGVVGHGEGKFGDDDLHAGGAGQVESFGEAVESEDDAGFAFFYGLVVFLQEDGFGQFALYEQERQVVFGQAQGDILHLFARGKQDERADGFGGRNELGQPFDNGGGVRGGVFGTGVHGRDVEFALRVEIKRAF